MGIIDKLSGKLGLMGGDEEEEMYAEEKVESKPPEKKPEPIVRPAFGAIDPSSTPQIENFVGHNVVDFNSEMAARKTSTMPLKTSVKVRQSIFLRNYPYPSEL